MAQQLYRFSIRDDQVGDILTAIDGADQSTVYLLRVMPNEDAYALAAAHAQQIADETGCEFFTDEGYIYFVSTTKDQCAVLRDLCAKHGITPEEPPAEAEEPGHLGQTASKEWEEQYKKRIFAALGIIAILVTFLIAAIASNSRGKVDPAPVAHDHYDTDGYDPNQTENKTEPPAPEPEVPPAPEPEVPPRIPCGNTSCDPGSACLSTNPDVCGPRGHAVCGDGYCEDPKNVCISNNPPTCAPPGSSSCGSRICDPGSDCLSTNPDVCGPRGHAACGNSYCNNSNDVCLRTNPNICGPRGAQACGNGYCNPGRFCLDTYPPSCSAPGSTLCGSHICNPGAVCLSTNPDVCGPRGAQVCGNIYCFPGWHCVGYGLCQPNWDW